MYKTSKIFLWIMIALFLFLVILRFITKHSVDFPFGNQYALQLALNLIAVSGIITTLWKYFNGNKTTPQIIVIFCMCFIYLTSWFSLWLFLKH